MTLIFATCPGTAEIKFSDGTSATATRAGVAVNNDVLARRDVPRMSGVRLATKTETEAWLAAKTVKEEKPAAPAPPAAEKK